jgi:cytochrome c553
VKGRDVKDTRLILLAAGFAMAFAAAAGDPPAGSAGDPGAGREKTRMCAGCHGIDDYRIAYPAVYAVPRLGGQDAGYVAKSLEAYRSGTRKHVAMQAMAAQLTDKDIADIAAFYSEGAAK